MPELASIKTEYFECVIWTKVISASQKRLAQTMSTRNLELPCSSISFSPPITVFEIDTPLEKYQCDSALFFENKQYDIEFIFNLSLKKSFEQQAPEVQHKLKKVEDAFHYSARSNSLRATISTGNDIGWFNIELLFPLNGKQFKQCIAFEVLPTKIDMNSDLERMNADIDSQYPLWRFSLAEKTSHQFKETKKNQPQFLLLWLAQFENLRTELETGLKHIVNAPHSRLVKITSSLKAEKLKGKLTPKLESSVKQAINNGLTNKRFTVNKQKLNIDTPENRFIKSVIKTSTNKLAQIGKLARNKEKSLENPRLSESFFKQLSTWQNSLQVYHRNRMFQEVGNYNGLSRESLVLQQKPGYAKVYRVWQKLKWYFELLGNDASLSLRNVAELYEVWCFLEVRDILLDLGFSELSNKKAELFNTGIEVSMKDGFAGAFLFERQDGIKLRLAHEPIFRDNTKPIKTWLTAQEPDILLEATFPDGSAFIWLFDAKYRIKPNEAQDLVPDDAINQLHRYRDALIHLQKLEAETYRKTRPVFGAYALYPGFYDQENEENPYQEAISEIGIGAFSLLPSGDKGQLWLQKFLKEKLGPACISYNLASTDKYFVEEASRISYYGMQQSRHRDLTLVVTGAPKSGRTQTYLDKFKNGTARWYHMKLLASDRDKVESHLIREISCCSITSSDKILGRTCSFLWPVRSVTLIERKHLTVEQSGSDKQSDELYWLFELGSSLSLSTPITGFPSVGHHMKLTIASELDRNSSFPKLRTVYDGLALSKKIV